MNTHNFILINGRFLSQQMTGVHRYAYEICCALHSLGVHIKVLAPDKVLPQYQCPFEVINIGGTGSHWWEQITLPRYVKKHYKGNRLLSLTGLSPISYQHNILTIHDVSYLVEPKWFSKTYYYLYKFLTPIAARKAEKIITVSEFSKRELIKYLHLPEHKIHIVHCGVRQWEKATGKIDDTYILSVCSMDPRKNLKRLLDAFLKANISHKLYLAGGTYAAFADNDMQRYRQNDNIVFLGYVGDERLQTLYHSATAFVNVSLYEGFGIPNIEAMQQGTPLLLSDIPVYHEICGDAALYVNPNDTASISAGIRQIVEDPLLRARLTGEGDKQYQQFNWRSSAQRIIELYEQ